jgi:ketosteroid isomerase-like protein
MQAALISIFALTLVSGCATPSAPATDPQQLRRQVAETERAFAKTMADRDFAAFTTFLSDDAIFFSGDKALRGKREIANAWRALYATPKAPFSWEPSQVEVLDAGDLALSTGPVRDGEGKLLATFTSIWRLEAPHTWRVVFDKGNDVCECTGK